jgi:hypothetical protein
VPNIHTQDQATWWCGCGADIGQGPLFAARSPVHGPVPGALGEL